MIGRTRPKRHAKSMNGRSQGSPGRVVLGVMGVLMMVSIASAQQWTPACGFEGTLSNSDWFGNATADIGDLDGDGVEDIAVGNPRDDDGGAHLGAVWILFLNTDGSVKTYQKISATRGGFTGTLNASDWFGYSVANLGDVDNDGVTDLAVGAIGDDDGDTSNGAVWVLFLNADGTVKSHQKISDTEGGFTDMFTSGMNFGDSVTGLGDLDGDTVEDLAVGAEGYDNTTGTGFRHGAVWVLFLNADGTVKSHQKISEGHGGFTGPLVGNNEFGSSLAAPGDLDNDTVDDLVVGSWVDPESGFAHGAIWVLLMNTNGTVKSHQKISEGIGGFGGDLNNVDNFGIGVTGLGDLDGDTVEDLAVGAFGDNGDGAARGAVWILFMNTNGTVKNHQKIGDGTGGFTGTLIDADNFGTDIATPGDLDNDGNTDLVVGAYRDNDGGGDRGAAWVLLLNANGTVKNHYKISNTGPCVRLDLTAFLAGPYAPPPVNGIVTPDQPRERNLRHLRNAQPVKGDHEGRPTGEMLAQTKALGGNMSTALRAGGYLPTTQPYDGAPWNYAGFEVTPGLPENAVDWVLVSLRTGDPTAPPMTVVAERAGLLLADGSIVEHHSTDAMPLEFPVADGSYYFTVTHRNHLGILSDDPRTLSEAATAYDFTIASGQAFGTNPMQNLGTFNWGLWSGDGDANGSVTAFDFLNVWLSQNGGPAGYHAGDFNMDGAVTAFDFLNGWIPANGQAAQVP